MQLQLQSFTSLVSNAAAAVQGTGRQLVDLTVGSTLRAILEANASIGLWMQWLLLQVLRTTRAATSQGSDLDTWMTDFTLSRLPAVSANGAVTFSRFVAIGGSLVPAGTVVRTADGSQSFVVQPDPSNSAWNPTQNGYFVPAGVASVTTPVAAATPGSAGNVLAGTVTLITAALPGIDFVTNAGPMQGGQDAESDVALRTRFQGFLDSRTRATRLAVSYAIGSVQQGLQFTIAENQSPDGSARMGYFTVTADDGSGSPPAPLISAIANAIEAVRPIGSSYAVLPPTVIPVTISLAIQIAAGASHGTLAGSATTALLTFVNTLPIGAPLTWSRVSQVVYDANPMVVNVTNVLLNGGTNDILVPSSGVIKATAVQVS